MKPIIVFVVGHESWGKSHTLRFLTHGSWRARYIEIKGTEFYIRRMSNDDRPKSYIEFMESLSPQHTKFLIAALCPNFERENARTASILESLNVRGYQLFFWVIQQRYASNEQIKPSEITQLKSYGVVELFSENAQAQQRADALRMFIETNVIV